MSDDFEKAFGQVAAFQKIWTESITKMVQTAFSMAPHSAPPEILRQVRSGLFEALAQSWDEFMRSPQFLAGMRQLMDNAVSFRKASNDLMARMRNEMQAPSREDIDTVMLSVRHMETRLLDRIEVLSSRITELNQRLANGESHSAARKSSPARTNKNRRRSTPGNGKVKRP